jgi:hypothetical protein
MDLWDFEFGSPLVSSFEKIIGLKLRVSLCDLCGLCG